MRVRTAVVAVLVTVVVALTGFPPGTQAAATSNEPAIAAVYPNPVADGDRGEFVVLSVPPATDLGQLALADDDSAVALPNATGSGRIVLSTAPNVSERLTDGPVYRLPTGLELANSGERLALRRGDGRLLDTLAYSDADEGAVLNASTGRWHPLGATGRPVVTAGSGTARAFVLPDAAGVPVGTLRSAEGRILLAGYTLTSQRVTDALVAAAERNVTVRVLVDGAPVGGMPGPEVARLNRLAAAGIEVRVLGGEYARYDFHHAKYAVVDDRALVTTENWVSTGTGGHGNRGWGVVVSQPSAVRGLVATFRADAGWRGAVPWTEARSEATVTRDRGANATYPARFEPRRVRVEQVRLLVAPDNAEREVTALLRNATDSIRIEQVSIGSRRQPFLRATLGAARRGVDVRILLSGKWYVREENRKLVASLRRRARREGLPLEARVIDPHGRFGKIHAKGVVVDGDQVVVGSLNWNNHSARQNREVAVVLRGEEAGRYFRRVFRADWRGGRWTLPVGVAVCCLLGAVVGTWRAKRLSWATVGPKGESSTGSGVPDGSTGTADD